MYISRRLKPIFLYFLLSLLGLNACKYVSWSMFSPEATRSIFTQVAETIGADSTLISGHTAVARLTQIAVNATATGAPTQVVPTSIPASPTQTPVPPSPTWVPPTAIPIQPIYPTYAPFPPIYPTYIPIPPVYPTPFPIPPPPPPTPCDWSQYVKDVTVPDGASLYPGEGFTKIWRMRNIGSCTWNPYYSLIFTNGNRMQGHNFVPLPEVVYPGETVDLAVDLVAPAEPGHYRGYWMLSNSYGQPFGIGENAQKAFWVDIEVASPVRTEYDFADNICEASWRNKAQNLPCPGNVHDSRGSVVLLEDPILENGKHKNEFALWMRPQEINDGRITGIFPNYKVHPGDRFVADIGCLIDSPGCDVVFRLDYQIDGQDAVKIGSWREVYDGGVTRLTIDLTSLAGKSVHFILRVDNKGNPGMANALWLAPSIQRAPPISVMD